MYFTHSLFWSHVNFYKHLCSNSLCSNYRLCRTVSHHYNVLNLLTSVSIFFFLFAVSIVTVCICSSSDVWVIITVLSQQFYICPTNCTIYRMSQGEMSILWEVIVSVILSKMCVMYICPIANGFQDRAVSLFSCKIADKLFLIGKGKTVPLHAWTGPEGSRKLRPPDFVTTAQDGGKVVSLTHRPPLSPGNTPGTHFC